MIKPRTLGSGKRKRVKTAKAQVSSTDTLLASARSGKELARSGKESAEKAVEVANKTLGIAESLSRRNQKELKDATNALNTLW